MVVDSALTMYLHYGYCALGTASSADCRDIRKTGTILIAVGVTQLISAKEYSWHVSGESMFVSCSPGASRP